MLPTGQRSWRYRRGRLAGRCGHQPRVLCEDRRLRGLQLRSGLYPDLGDQVTASLRVGLERVRLPAGGVERLDEQHAQSLTERVLLDELASSPMTRTGQARLDVLGQPGLLSRETVLLQPGRDSPRPRIVCPLEQGRTRAREPALRRTARLDEVLEAEQRPQRREAVEAVTSGTVEIPDPELPAQISHVTMHQVGSGPGRFVTPESVDDPVGSHWPTTVQQQQGKQRAWLGSGLHLGAVVVEHSKGAEQPELHIRSPSVRLQGDSSAAPGGPPRLAARPTTRGGAMVIHIVRFRSTLSDERIAELFQGRASGVPRGPGLLQKYYLRFRSGEHGGIYVWESEAAMEEFMASWLARSICDVYRVEESVKDVADVVLAFVPPTQFRMIFAARYLRKSRTTLDCPNRTWPASGSSRTVACGTAPFQPPPNESSMRSRPPMITSTGIPRRLSASSSNVGSRSRRGRKCVWMSIR